MRENITLGGSNYCSKFSKILRLCVQTKVALQKFLIIFEYKILDYISLILKIFIQKLYKFLRKIIK